MQWEVRAVVGHGSRSAQAPAALLLQMLNQLVVMANYCRYCHCCLLAIRT